MATVGQLGMFKLLFVFTLIWHQALTTDSIPRDCSDEEAGMPVIRPAGSQAFNAYCSGDGSAVIMSNVGGGDWDREANAYSSGFGEFEEDKNFWLGNQKSHAITSQPDAEYELIVDLWDAEGTATQAIYETFTISDSTNGFFISYGEYNEAESTAPDGLGSITRNRLFSTKDQDRDGTLVTNGVNKNCADLNRAGWWYYGDDCATTILTTPEPLWNDVVYAKALMSVRNINSVNSDAEN